MNSTTLLAWAGLVMAGFFAGSFAIPSKKVRILSWNQTWLNFSLAALCILPMGIAALLAPGIFGVLSDTSNAELATVAGFGILWGVGALLFGLAIAHSGFAVANTLVCGMVACVGAAGPLLLGTGKLQPGEVLPLAIGLVLLCAGIAICGVASHLRGGQAESHASKGGSATLGVILSLLSGIFSAMINFSFAAGAGLIKQAETAGIHPALTTLAVWVPALLGGFLINAGSSVFRMIRAGETTRYRKAPPGDWLRGFAMGAIWFLALMSYGVFSLRLGSSGAVFGWAFYSGFAIVVSVLWGFATDEWKTAPQRARRFMITGVALCVLAFVVLAVGR